jgi:Alpha/beta hydrolase domain
VARDPVTGVEGSILDRARALGLIPKLFYVNNSSEYWNRAASLIATDPVGLRDLTPAPEARIYLIAGAQHYIGNLRERGIFSNCVNTLNHYRVMRALMLAFDRWVRNGVEPPPSIYPRIADGTLVTIAAHALAFPRMPGFRLPEGNLRPPRLDLGSRFETDRIADEVPPIMGKSFETLVPKPNAEYAGHGLGAAMRLLGPPWGERFQQLFKAVGQPRLAPPPRVIKPAKRAARARRHVVDLF